MKPSRRGTLSILNETFRGYRRHLVLLVILGIVSSLLDGISISAIVPLSSFLLGEGGAQTDFITRSISALFAFAHIPFQFRYLLILVAVMFVGRAVVLTFFTYIRAHINARFMTREIGSLFQGTLLTEWSFILRQKVGNIQNTVFWDAKRNANLLDTLVQFAQSSTGSLIYLIVAFNISPGVTLITLFGGVIIFLIMRPLLKKTRGYGEETSKSEKLLAHHVTEHIQGFKTVKVAGAIGNVVASAETYLARLRHAYTRSALVQSLSSIYIQPLSFLFIIGVFAFSYKSASFSLAAFAATLYLIQKIFVYFESTQSTVHAIAQLIPFAENILNFKAEVRAHTEKENGAGRAFRFEKAIEFRDVSFSYESGAQVLSGVSLTIPKGAMLGIIGPSGGGKTSLADLLLRLFRPTVGGIYLDGVPAPEVRMSEWRRRIGYVSQDTFLMNASVRDNIRFYDDSITDADVETAARKAHIYDDIMRLSEGFNTVIGDRGVTLSGGQRQRVALARTLARKPEVLVLDEVTSSLDSELERLIQQVIDELRGDVTLVLIAHRISTIIKADRLIVLSGGTVSERGTPEEMLKNPDSYLSRMTKLQSSGLERE